MKKLFIPLMVVIIFSSCKENEKTKVENETKPEAAANIAVSKWMSWDGGMDVAGVTDTGYKMPNVIFHVANMVNTPVGSAPSGMVLYQTDTASAPIVMGFVSSKKEVGDYFGPNIFAGTPFEKAPTLIADFKFTNDGTTATAIVKVDGHTFECTMTDFGSPYLINRVPSAMPPFYQQGVEQKTGKTTLKFDGKEINLFIPPVGITGGPGSVLSPNGVYAR